MQHALVQALDYFNLIVVMYFVVANGVYTVLMLLSMYAVTLHARFAARRGYIELSDTPTTPPVALIVPAHNEQSAIIPTVFSLLELNYPEKEIIVVDDGSSDETVSRLIERFELRRIDLIYRESVSALRPTEFYCSLKYPELLLVVKPNGGKPDALNVGVNVARSPYLCTVDADSLIERDALLRLMAPVVHSKLDTIVSGGVVRIANGCKLRHGRIAEVDLPKGWLERCQVVEYIRAFLFGRPGWNFLNATFICSGAFCLLKKAAVIAVNGFTTDTVTEDIDLISSMHRHFRRNKLPYRMVFTTDPVCWTEAPRTLSMLARQRRRWQLGLVQTVIKHHEIMGSPRYGMLGMLSMPFHTYVEALGCLVEALGTLLVPISFVLGVISLPMFLLILLLAVGYGTLLSIGAVLLEETTLRRYPKWRHVATLAGYAVLENLGYRQMLTFIRAHGVLRYFFGTRQWEPVEHKGLAAATAEAQ